MGIQFQIKDSFKFIFSYAFLSHDSHDSMTQTYTIYIFRKTTIHTFEQHVGSTITVTSYGEHDSVSNHQPQDCLLNRLTIRRSKKHQSSASLAFVRGIHRGPVNSPHKGPVTRKMFPFHDVIMSCENLPYNTFLIQYVRSSA